MVIENVWDYPRPPRLEPVAAEVRIDFAGAAILRSRGAWRVLETSHPPSYYLPPEDFAPGVLTPAVGASHCEWKGIARYWDITAGGRTARRAAWSYPDPTPGFLPIRGYLAVYPSRMDRIAVGSMPVAAQDGDFYGGWITPNLRGPFKGAPGTRFW